MIMIIRIICVSVYFQVNFLDILFFLPVMRKASLFVTNWEIPAIYPPWSLYCESPLPQESQFAT